MKDCWYSETMGLIVHPIPSTVHQFKVFCQWKVSRDVVEGGGKDNAIMAAIKFPYIVSISHA